VNQVSARGDAGGQHRPDVQALRALAVTAVLLFHLWPGLVPGGYVGVDVFFVVSGYLITGQLFRELSATGRVRVLDFYARRIRRLIPAAFFVLAATLVAMLLLLPMLVWRTNLADIAAAATYVLNWHLAWTNTDYLAAAETPSMVQHYWSLSVEEQFYVVWPLLLVTGAWGGGRLLHASRRASTVVVLLVVFVLSLSRSVVETRVQPEVAFFATRDRAWEFALGGLVALLAPTLLSRPVARVAGWSGVGLIIASCLVLTRGVAFPGYLALLPTGAAALALAAGAAPGRGSVARASAWPPVQWVGDHSYALYLWHWPLIVALPWVLHAPMSHPARVLALGATVGLAWVTKRYVEDPVRHGAWWRARLWPAFELAVVGSLAFLLTITAAAHHLQGVVSSQERLAAANITSARTCYGAAALQDPACSAPYARPSAAAVAFAPTDFPPMDQDCQQPQTDGPDPQWCTFGDPDPDAPTVALVGNSFALQFAPMFQEWAQGRSIRIVLASRVGCLGLTTEPVSGQSTGDPCLAWSALVQARLLGIPSLRAVFFVSHEDSAAFVTGQSHPGSSVLDQASQEVMETWTRFSDVGVRTAVIEHAPGPGTNAEEGLECLVISDQADDPCAFPRSRLPEPDAVTALAQDHPELTTYIPTSSYFCDEDTCHTTIGGVVAYYAGSHISTTYVRTLTPYLGQVVGDVAGLPMPTAPPVDGGQTTTTAGQVTRTPSRLDG
jgi:peptidoglycan/LPS O-acetylase OafA/YrhL